MSTLAASSRVDDPGWVRGKRKTTRANQRDCDMPTSVCSRGPCCRTDSPRLVDTHSPARRASLPACATAAPAPSRKGDLPRADQCSENLPVHLGVVYAVRRGYGAERSSCWQLSQHHKRATTGRKGWMLWGLALSSVCTICSAMNGGALVLSDRGGAMSSPAYANTFETWNCFSKRTSTSPVTFRLQAETKFGWEVCVTGGCEALGYWDPDKALLLRTDPARYPIWEGVGQLPGGCDIEYKYLMRPRGRCPSFILHLRCSSFAFCILILALTDA